MRLRPSILFLLAAVASLPAGAQSPGSATIRGVVRDSAGGTLPGVSVTASRAGKASPSVQYTSAEGDFRFVSLAPGTYEVAARLDGFQPISKTVTLVTGQKLELAFRIFPALSESVEVTAAAVRAGEVEVLESRREAAAVSDRISSEEIRKTPDASAGAVVERLTGVTLLDNKFVFIRGLGERYAGATLNGATLPTTETEKRAVPLDLLPAKLLSAVSVLKTTTPDKPGDFGSGVVEMATTDFPAGGALRLGLGTGYSSTATGEAIRRYAGGLDLLGRGGQPLPDDIPSSPLRRKSLLDPNGFTPAELERFGESFVGDWSGRSQGAASPDLDGSLSYGNTFGPVGLVLSATSSHGYDRVDETQRFFGLDSGGALVPRNDYDLTTDREHATLGLVANVALRLGEMSRASFHSVLTRNGTAANRYQEGLNTNTGGFIRDYRASYELEDVLSLKLDGEQNLGGPGLGSLVEWSLARSKATNDSNLRENLYRESDEGEFTLQTGYPESGKMEFFGLTDRVDEGALSWSTFLVSASGSTSATLKAGGRYQKRTRDFSARRFRFATSNALQFDLAAPPEEIFTPANIRPNGFEIREITGLNDAYGAQHDVAAGYVMADVTSGAWRVVGGARYEDSDQRVTTVNPFDTAIPVVSRNQDGDLLPSLNVVYSFDPKTDLRLAYGRSVNRPEFRELSPFTFVEVTGGRSIVGNPDLVEATIDAFDARFETFPAPGEILALSAFAKRINRPIERIVQPTTELRTSFVNAEQATLWGLEVELRRSLDVLSPALRAFSVNFNYAYVRSDVTVGEKDLSVVTNLDRPLAGQSDHVANLAVQFLQPDWGTMVRLLGSYKGKRLTDVGAYGLADIYEQAFFSLDAVLSQALPFLAKGLEVKLSATNLLDADHTYEQGLAEQRRFDPGRSFSVQLGYSPF